MEYQFIIKKADLKKGKPILAYDFRNVIGSVETIIENQVVPNHGGKPNSYTDVIIDITKSDLKLLLENEVNLPAVYITSDCKKIDHVTTFEPDETARKTRLNSLKNELAVSRLEFGARTDVGLEDDDKLPDELMAKIREMRDIDVDDEVKNVKDRAIGSVKALARLKLSLSDRRVLRHFEERELKLKTSLSDKDFKNLLKRRQKIREASRALVDEIKSKKSVKTLSEVDYSMLEKL